MFKLLTLARGWLADWAHDRSLDALDRAMDSHCLDDLRLRRREIARHMWWSEFWADAEAAVSGAESWAACRARRGARALSSLNRAIVRQRRRAF